MSHPDFKKFVENAWNSYSVQGWVGYIVKEKLKFLKSDLKKWNQENFGIIENKIDTLKNKIHELDIMDDIFGLEEGECIRRKEATT